MNDETKSPYAIIAEILGYDMPDEAKAKLEVLCLRLGVTDNDVLKSLLIGIFSDHNAVKQTTAAIRDIITTANAKALEDARQRVAPEIDRLTAEAKKEIAKSAAELAKNAHDATVATAERKTKIDYLRVIITTFALGIILVVGGMLLENQRLILSPQEIKDDIAERQKELDAVKRELADQETKHIKFDFAKKYVDYCGVTKTGNVWFRFSPDYQLKESFMEKNTGSAVLWLTPKPGTNAMGGQE